MSRTTRVLVAGALAALSAGAFAATVSAAPPADPTFAAIGSYRADIPLSGDDTAAETFAVAGGRMYVTNVVNGTLDVVDITDPASSVRLDRIPLLASPNSIAAHGALVAVALDAPVKTDPGVVRVFRRDGGSLAFVADVPVGAGPDMVTFAHEGETILVALEGEPSGYGAEGVDPVGGVAIIDVEGILDGRAPRVRTAGFEAFNAGAPRHGELPAGLRLNGPGASVAQDLEPEYITMGTTGNTAHVTLQENNAVAEVDLRRARITRIVSMGLRDHSLPGHGIDASDRDDPNNPSSGGGNAGAINIRNWPVSGIPMPDGIASFRVRGVEYLITANEGDAREWGSFADVGRAGSLTLDPASYPDAAIRQNRNLGRLNVSLTDGRNAAGAFTRLHSFGSRSVSVMRPDGTLVWDSGDRFERTVAAQRPAAFNVSSTNNTFDNRSDDKGPEPEGVAVGRIDGRTYAFVALERAGGVMVLDISDPRRGRVVQWATTRDTTKAPATTDSAPEIVRFLAPAESPTGAPLVAISNEVSGSVVFFAPTTD